MLRIFLQNTRRPEGLGGRLAAVMVDRGHTALARWGPAELTVRRGRDRGWMTVTARDPRQNAGSRGANKNGNGEQMMERPDYKNWVPRGMMLGFIAAAGVLLACLLAFGAAGLGVGPTARRVLCAGFGTAFLICAAYALWCVAAYRAFSYSGTRQLSRRIVEGTAAYITLPEGGLGLDVGCGSGALTIACAKRNPQGAMVGIDRWGREYASFSLPLCQQNAAAEGAANVSFQRGDALRLDFPEGRFDAVASNYVYHNIPGADRQQLLLETLRVLKKGGCFAIHDIMTPRRYGDMAAFAQRLRGLGYAQVELIDTTDGLFMTRREAGLLSLKGSMLLTGRK